MKPLRLLLVSLCVASIVTAPALLKAHTHTLGALLDPDLQCGLWWPGAFWSSLLSGENPFLRQELGWPEGQDTRLLLWNFGAQLSLLPTALLSPPLSLNLGALWLQVLNGMACGFLGFRASRSQAGGVAGAVVGASSMHTWFESASGRPEQGLIAPIALYFGAWIGLRRSPGDKKEILLASVSLALAGAVYWFQAYFLVVLTPLLALRRDRTSLRDMLLVGVGSLILVMPFLLPLLPVLTEPGNPLQLTTAAHDPFAQGLRGSLHWPGSYLGGLAMGRDLGSQLTVLALPVAALAFVHGERRSAAALVLAALFGAGHTLSDGNAEAILVGGRQVLMPSVLIDWLPGWNRFWWPYRWLSVAGVALVAALSPVLTTWRRVLPFIVLVLAEALWWARGIDDRLHPVLVPDEMRALAQREGVHPIVVYPLAETDNGMIGLIPFLGQPIDGGLAWNAGEDMRSAQWEKRSRETGLFQSLRSIREGSEYVPATPMNDTAGFEYVLVVKPLVHDPGQLEELDGMLPLVAEESLWRLYAIPQVP